MLFIVIHQVYELWFKQMLWELDHLQASCSTPATSCTWGGTRCKRVLTILKVMVAQIDVLETMTPIDVRSFRERLDSASGFQSAQFRELEACSGTAGAAVRWGTSRRVAGPGAARAAGWRADVVGLLLRPPGAARLRCSGRAA